MPLFFTLNGEYIAFVFEWPFCRASDSLEMLRFWAWIGAKFVQDAFVDNTSKISVQA